MCRSTIARVVALDGTDAIVECDGVRRRAIATFAPDVRPGDEVLIGLGTVLGIVRPSDVEALRALGASGPIPTTRAIPAPLPRTPRDDP